LETAINFKKSLEIRCIKFGNYIVNNKTTVRATAKKFGISKSTVHKDVSVRLKKLDLKLYKNVHKILEKNKKERHIRGGIATRKKYKGD
jgi:putative DeoR family transcriptional regulator (stage III sporulation protein D)